MNLWSSLLRKPLGSTRMVFHDLSGNPQNVLFLASPTDDDRRQQHRDVARSSCMFFVIDIPFHLRIGAESVNLIAGDKRADVYSCIAAKYCHLPIMKLGTDTTMKL